MPRRIVVGAVLAMGVGCDAAPLDRADPPLPTSTSLDGVMPSAMPRLMTPRLRELPRGSDEGPGVDSHEWAAAALRADTPVQGDPQIEYGLVLAPTGARREGAEAQAQAIGEFLAQDHGGPVAALRLPGADELDKALRAATKGLRPAGPLQADPWPYLPRDRTKDSNASVSVGNVTTGNLLRGKRLPAEGRGYRVNEATHRRGYVEGGDVLLALIESAAAAVHSAHPGSVLRVGNLSRPGGGDIETSVSHNSGRDVDLGFYVAGPAGEPLDAVGFVDFDEAGVSRGLVPAVYFDGPRNWALVRAFLTSNIAQAQYIFVADWLKTFLIDYAIRAGEPAELVMRAERVLQQPRDSSPHADHFHVRIYCDLHDRLAGCHDFGPVHPWVRGFEDQVQARIEALLDMYQSGKPEERAYALSQLDLLTKVPAVEEGDD